MRASETDEHVGLTLDDRYRLLAPIGRGASARVYVAEDLSLDRRVAVKLLHAGLSNDRRFARRFESEARSAAQLNNPHVLAVYDWSGSEPAYLVSELLEGGSLRGVLDRSGTLSPSQTLLVGLHAAQGLAYAHRHGFVHRDVKPANLLFDVDGRLRIADFGIARAVAEAAWTEPEGALVGTARYAAPEQASGAVVDGRADVYGLAITLVESLTGEVPLLADGVLATMVRRQDENLRTPARFAELGELLDQAGRADPEERISAHDLARGLNRVASTLTRPEPLALAGLADGILDADPVTPTDDSTAVIDLRTDEPTSVLAVTPEPEVRRQEPAGEALDVSGSDVSSFDDDRDEVIEVVDDHRRWPFLLALVLLIGAAGYAYSTRTLDPDDLPGVFGGAETHTMGGFVGRDLADVQRDLDLNGWTASVSRVRQDGTVVDEVLTQSPDPGVEWEEGAEVTLVVSDGPEIRQVPQLVGLSRQEARDALSEVNLAVGEIVEVNDETAPADQVLSASVDAGVEQESGSAVDLTISLGPAARSVPPLTGLTLEAATPLVSDAGLVLASTEDYSMDVPEGQIISVDPEVGAEIARDETVDVVVSLGRPFVNVPNVVGMSAAEAATELEAAGFVVADTEGAPNAEVLATNPPAGEGHRFGTSIIIFTR